MEEGFSTPPEVSSSMPLCIHSKRIRSHIAAWEYARCIRILRSSVHLFFSTASASASSASDDCLIQSRWAATTSAVTTRSSSALDTSSGDSGLDRASGKKPDGVEGRARLCWSLECLACSWASAARSIDADATRRAAAARAPATIAARSSKGSLTRAVWRSSSSVMVRQARSAVEASVAKSWSVSEKSKLGKVSTELIFLASSAATARVDIAFSQPYDAAFNCWRAFAKLANTRSPDLKYPSIFSKPRSCSVFWACAIFGAARDDVKPCPQLDSVRRSAAGARFPSASGSTGALWLSSFRRASASPRSGRVRNS
mmetsp:Transcript_74878/g.199619  ORF Transcript_74878/g.199619 Transcript_74878/m.199619 type:complete len:314 (+) Transcript_74878:384-1325(+)